MKDGFIGAITEGRFEYRGFPCVIVMQASAFRTGYVGLPHGHKYYGEDYAEIPVICHGGLTYSRPYLIGQEDKNTWWIGYDTGHWGDGYDYEAALHLFKDYPKTVEMLQRNIELGFGVNTEFRARSLQYCMMECKRIVDQLLSEVAE